MDKLRELEYKLYAKVYVSEYSQTRDSSTSRLVAEEAVKDMRYSFKRNI